MAKDPDRLRQVTNSDVAAGKGRNEGYNDAQLTMLGVPVPAQRGWKHRLVGTQARVSDIRAFVALKDTHLPYNLAQTNALVARIRDESGVEVDDRRLVAFLYWILRDDIVLGRVERIVRDIEEAGQLDFEYSMEHVLAYAKEVAERLLVGT